LRAADREQARWLASLLRPHGAAIAALIALSLCTSALVMVQPWLTKLLIDNGLLARDTHALVVIALGMFGVGLAASLFGGINRYFYTRLSGRILFSLREGVFRHLQTLSPAFYARNRAGDILARLDGDVAEIQRFSIDSLFAGISGLFGLLGTVGFMLYISPGLSLLAFAMIPLQWFYLRFMRRRVQERVRQVRERASDISSFLVEMLPAMKFVQSAAAGDRESTRLGELNRRYLGDLLNLQLTEFATSAVPSNLTGALRATVFIVGGYQVIEGRMALGSLIAFSTYLGMAMGPVQSLLGVYMALSRVRVNFDRVRYLREARADVEPRGIRKLPPDSPGEIRLENLCFGYPGEAGAVIRNASLCIPAGARVGLHGPSGSGKTTLVDLLLRHYDPDSGRILIDGVDLRDLALDDWRRSVASVAQDIVLFRGSVLDNIRYVNPDAGPEAVGEAVRRAGLEETIARLPQGLDTAIGERGARLSGGERQRLAIARALLQDPVLIIFDEATSAVDQAAERAVMEELNELFPRTTRLIVSHRDTPLEGADLLICVRNGDLLLESRAPA
jgi:ATP-binding cassette subfamily B protein